MHAWGFEFGKINFKVQTNCAITGKVSFHQYFQVFHMNFKISFRHLVLTEMISFEKICLKQSH